MSKLPYRAVMVLSKSKIQSLTFPAHAVSMYSGLHAAAVLGRSSALVVVSAVR